MHKISDFLRSLASKAFLEVHKLQKFGEATFKIEEQIPDEF